jgi:hypothetical protein
MSHIIDVIAEFLVCRGHTSIVNHPGLLIEHAGAFTVIANGHNETIDDVPGCCFSILFNQHPFAMLTATGEGSMGTGMVANPDSFRGALNEAIREARVAGRADTQATNGSS